MSSFPVDSLFTPHARFEGATAETTSTRLVFCPRPVARCLAAAWRTRHVGVQLCLTFSIRLESIQVPIPRPEESAASTSARSLGTPTLRRSCFPAYAALPALLEDSPSPAPLQGIRASAEPLTLSVKQHYSTKSNVTSPAWARQAERFVVVREHRFTMRRSRQHPRSTNLPVTPATSDAITKAQPEHCPHIRTIAIVSPTRNA